MSTATRTRKRVRLRARIVPQLDKPLVVAYRRMQELKEEESRIGARMKELHTERKNLEARLVRAFGKRISMGISREVMLYKRDIIVPQKTLVRPEYKYYRWDEVMR